MMLCSAPGTIKMTQEQLSAFFKKHGHGGDVVKRYLTDKDSEWHKKQLSIQVMFSTPSDSVDQSNKTNKQVIEGSGKEDTKTHFGHAAISEGSESDEVEIIPLKTLPIVKMEESEIIAFCKKHGVDPTEAMYKEAESERKNRAKMKKIHKLLMAGKWKKNPLSEEEMLEEAYRLAELLLKEGYMGCWFHANGQVVITDADCCTSVHKNGGRIGKENGFENQAKELKNLIDNKCWEKKGLGGYGVLGGSTNDIVPRMIASGIKEIEIYMNGVVEFVALENDVEYSNCSIDGKVLEGILSVPVSLVE